MEFELSDRFLRDLNPDLHFKATPKGYRLTSAVFRQRDVGEGYYACSVDSERIVGERATQERVARGHGQWGVGRISLRDVRTIGEGDVILEPEGSNDAHCTLTFRDARKSELARACEVILKPTDMEWVRNYAGRELS